MKQNYSNKVVGLKRRVAFILEYLDSDYFDINQFFALMSDLEDAYYRLSDSLRQLGFNKFSNMNRLI